MQSLSVNPAQLHQLSSTVRQHSDHITRTVADLKAEVARLKGSWDGQAKDAYEAAQRDWDRKIEELNNLLAQISAKTAQIGTGYTDTDSRQARNF